MTVVFTYLDNYLITTMTSFGSFCQLVSKKYVRQISILGNHRVKKNRKRYSRNKKAPVSLFRKLQYVLYILLFSMAKEACIIKYLSNLGTFNLSKYSRLDQHLVEYKLAIQIQQGNSRQNYILHFILLLLSRDQKPLTVSVNRQFEMKY